MNIIDLYQKPNGRSQRRSSRLHYYACCAVFGVTLLGIATLPMLAGCGGASHSLSSTASETGRATIAITWPTATTRLVPTASNSIVITFLQNGQTVATQTVARPTDSSQTSTTFEGLPVGSLTVTAAAYPDSDGTGTIQASAGITTTIASGQNTAVNITMASTIDHLSVTPANASVIVGQTTTLSEAAVDASSNIVLTSPSNITWASLTPAVASVDSSGVVTGLSEGTAQIQVTESESNKTATVSVTVTAVSTGTSIVDLANAYIATLSSTQQSATVVANNVTNLEKWSNLPASPSSSGTDTRRNGVAYSTLTSTQQAAWNTLVNAALGSAGVTQFNGIRAADSALRSNYSANGYSGDYQYLAFVGTPSTTGSWVLQLGGHHNAHNYYFTGTSLKTTVPYHLGVEPTSFTYNGTSYTPLAEQKTAMTNLLSSFSTSQLSSAKLSGSFGDLYLGAGQDARSNFPTGNTGRGILVSNLTSSQQTLVKTAIAAWVSKSPLASTYQSLYESELSSTYVGYAGNASAPGTVFTAQGDYIRIDGPHVWIELVCQNGVVVQGQIHYHTIWRDRVNDYNAVEAGYTLVNHSN